MKKIVAKFGGSSLSNAEQFQKVNYILRTNPARHYSVVSAPGKRDDADIKVTDLLYRCFDLAAMGTNKYKPALADVRRRFADIVEELGLDFDLNAEIEQMDAALASHPRRAYVASRGEYLNAKILAAYMGWDFIDPTTCIRFTPNGILDEEATERLLTEALNEHDYAVLPGFYGADENGDVHTFSRGGSDITGSLAACAAGADLYENWTDVSGMLFTDPRVVENPHTIDFITYQELRELSYMGASVLHEDAVFPVRKARISINVRNTNRPGDPGTMIVPAMPTGTGRTPVTGVAGKKGFANILIEKAMMNAEVGFGATLLHIFSAYGVPFEHCPTGIDTMSVVVEEDVFARHRTEIIKEINARLEPDAVHVETGLAMIAVVGRGMVECRGIAARIFKAVSDAGVNIRMIDQGSSEINIIIGVDESEYEAAVRGICKEFD